jgi:nucleoid-associated protein YgaU
MAAIAIKEYGRATPRLLDSICKANNLRNANFLQLGQSLTLPDYLPQSAQVAAGPSGQPH